MIRLQIGRPSAICIFTSIFTLICMMPASASNAPVGAAYVVTNKPDQNTVIGFARMKNGSHKTIGEFPTGGKGTGDLEVPGLSPRDDSHPLLDGQDPLISAYAIEKTQNGQFVLVANPGNRTISSMRVNSDYTLTTVSTVDSGGAFPVSIASHDDTVFVANIGKGNFKGRLAGFRINSQGKLTPIDDSVRKLDAYGGRPSALRFTPDGKHLVVTHILTGVIAVFANDNGNLSRKPVSQINSPQADDTRSLANPVGFSMINAGRNGAIAIVSEARFFAPALDLPKRDGQFFFQTSSTSSYRIDGQGEISLISGDALTGGSLEGGQRTNCWIGLSENGRFAYGVNALDSSISSYRVSREGQLSLLKEVAYKTPDYTFLTDIYPSPDGKYFYQLQGYGGKVSVLEIKRNGALKEKAILDGGVPTVGAFGILAL